MIELLAAWLADKVAGALIGEKAKRFVLRQPRERLATIEQELRDAKHRYEFAVERFAAVLAQKERLEGEVIRLRVENSDLRRRLAERA